MAETKLLLAIAAARSGGYARGRAAAAAPCLGHQPRGDELPINHLGAGTTRRQMPSKPCDRVDHGVWALADQEMPAVGNDPQGYARRPCEQKAVFHGDNGVSSAPEHHRRTCEQPARRDRRIAEKRPPGSAHAGVLSKLGEEALHRARRESGCIGYEQRPERHPPEPLPTSEPTSQGRSQSAGTEDGGEDRQDTRPEWQPGDTRGPDQHEPVHELRSAALPAAPPPVPPMNARRRRPTRSRATRSRQLRRRRTTRSSHHEVACSSRRDPEGREQRRGGRLAGRRPPRPTWPRRRPARATARSLARNLPRTPGPAPAGCPP